eukprot:5296101-Pyramimonas_sp.AAC.1
MFGPADRLGLPALPPAPHRSCHLLQASAEPLGCLCPLLLARGLGNLRWLELVPVVGGDLL